MTTKRLAFDAGLTVAVASIAAVAWRPLMLWRSRYVLRHGTIRAVLAEEKQAIIAGSSAPTEVFMGLLAEPRIITRHLAMSGLADLAESRRLRWDRLRPTLPRLLFDYDQEIREGAVALAVRHGSDDVMPYLLAGLSDVDPQIRFASAGALGRLGDPVAAGPLVEALDDPDPMVTSGLVAALRKLTGQDFGFRLNDNRKSRRDCVALWRTWWARQPHPRGDAPADKAAAAAAEQFPAPTAPPFRLRGLDGDWVSLERFRGKTVLLNFWATWCTPCLREIPELKALGPQLGDRSIILGISMGHLGRKHGTGGGETPTAADFQNVRRFVSEKGLGYPVVMGDQRVGRDYQAFALPVNVLVGPTGMMVRRFVGPRSADVLKAMIRQVGTEAASKPGR